MTCEHEGNIPSSITPQRLGRKLLIGSLDFIYMFLSFPFWFTPPSAAHAMLELREHTFFHVKNITRLLLFIIHKYYSTIHIYLFAWEGPPPLFS